MTSDEIVFRTIIFFIIIVTTVRGLANYFFIRIAFSTNLSNCNNEQFVTFIELSHKLTIDKSENDYINAKSLQRFKREGFVRLWYILWYWAPAEAVVF